MSLLFATLKVAQEIQNELISFMLRLTEAVYSKNKKELLKSAK
jgi:hypothetical protein